MKTKVREGEEKDVAGVLALEREAREAPHWEAGVYREIARGMVEPGGGGRRLVVAEVEEKLAGFAVGRVVEAGGEVEGELESVAVAGWARRRGVGRELCRAVVEWCEARGAVRIDLEVRAGGAGPQQLYRGLGFVEVGRRRRYYREPEEDAVLMRRESEGVSTAISAPGL